MRSCEVLIFAKISSLVGTWPYLAINSCSSFLEIFLGLADFLGLSIDV